MAVIWTNSTLVGTAHNNTKRRESTIVSAAGQGSDISIAIDNSRVTLKGELIEAGLAIADHLFGDAYTAL